jgi:hypothetical protein
VDGKSRGRIKKLLKHLPVELVSFQLQSPYGGDLKCSEGQSTGATEVSSIKSKAEKISEMTFCVALNVDQVTCLTLIKATLLKVESRKQFFFRNVLQITNSRSGYEDD